MKTKGVSVRREGSKGLLRFWSSITDQSGGKNLWCHAGRLLSEIRAAGLGQAVGDQ